MLKLAVLVLASAFLLTTTMLWGGVTMAARMGEAGRPSAEFRREHEELHDRLEYLSRELGFLPRMGVDERRRLFEDLRGFLASELTRHAEWEERVLYPAVDRRAGGGGGERFTATMRNDHRIIVRRIQELERLSRRSAVDLEDFVRKADRVIGLITAHFENEESVLLPILDRTMSREEFDREILDREPRPPRAVDEVIHRRGRP